MKMNMFFAFLITTCVGIGSYLVDLNLVNVCRAMLFGFLTIYAYESLRQFWDK